MDSKKPVTQLRLGIGSAHPAPRRAAADQPHRGDFRSSPSDLGPQRDQGGSGWAVKQVECPGAR